MAVWVALGVATYESASYLFARTTSLAALGHSKVFINCTSHSQLCCPILCLVVSSTVLRIASNRTESTTL